MVTLQVQPIQAVRRRPARKKPHERLAVNQEARCYVRIPFHATHTEEKAPLASERNRPEVPDKPVGASYNRAMKKPVSPGLVVAPQSEAAYAGASVLRDGGNAADATITAALVQGIVDPHRCGIGGFGCATLHFPASRGSLAVDFHGRSGKQCRADQWLSLYEGAAEDGFGYLLQGKVNDVGYQAIATPGVVAGLGEIHSRYATMPWKELVLRAVPYAIDGFQVTQALANFWIRPGLCGRVSTQGRLGFTTEGSRLALRPDRSPHPAGAVFQQPVLAETYRELAECGPEGFYRGPLAERIATDLAANGSFVTAEDLADYRPDVAAPLTGTYRDYEVVTTPLPGGGVALLQALKLLEEMDLRPLGHNSTNYIDRVAPVLRAVWSDRLAYHGDPQFDGLGADELLSKEYLESLRPGLGGSAGADSPDTTQLSVADGAGNVVSFSHSLGYGSGVFTPGLGFMYNNCMSAFDPRPKQRNSIAPGKARTTAVAETLLLRDGKPALVLGSPGAARITAGIVQAILNVVDFGMSIAEAVVHPRFDAFADRRLVLESRFPLELRRALTSRGWEVGTSQASFGVIGRVYAIELPTDGRAPVAGVDPGEPGAAWRG